MEATLAPKTKFKGIEYFPEHVSKKGIIMFRCDAVPVTFIGDELMYLGHTLVVEKIFDGSNDEGVFGIVCTHKKKRNQVVGTTKPTPKILGRRLGKIIFGKKVTDL
jgi:hypothetical protein